MMTAILLSLSTPLHSLASTARLQGTLTLEDVETMLRLVLQIHTARRQSPSSDNRPVSPASNTGTSGTACECGRGGEVLNTRTAKIIVLPRDKKGWTQRVGLANVSPKGLYHCIKGWFKLDRS